MKFRQMLARATRAAQATFHAGQAGALYFVTDEGKLEMWNGATWDAVAPANAHTHAWGDVSKVGSSLADLATRASSNLSDGANLAKKDADNGFSVEQTITGLVKPTLGLKERGRSFVAGEFVTVAFNAGNFLASGSMTWTVEAGDQKTYSYTLIGKLMILSVQVWTSTIGGTVSNYLRVAIPGGFANANPVVIWARVVNNGVYGAGYAYAGVGDTEIRVYRDMAGSNYALDTNGTSVQFNLAFEVQ